MSNYSHEQKEKLAVKINKLKNKQKLIDVLKIIQKDEAYEGVTENNNGLFMLFHKLNDDTYGKIEKYLKKKSTEDGTDASATSDTHTDSVTLYSSENYPFENQSRLKYSNREKCIIKRKLYDEALQDMATERETLEIKIDLEK
jgi:hypothetical protein